MLVRSPSPVAAVSQRAHFLGLNCVLQHARPRPQWRRVIVTSCHAARFEAGSVAQTRDTHLITNRPREPEAVIGQWFKVNLLLATIGTSRVPAVMLRSCL